MLQGLGDEAALGALFRSMGEWDDDRVVGTMDRLLTKLVPDWDDQTQAPDFSSLPDEGVTALGLFTALAIMPLSMGMRDPRVRLDQDSFIVPRESIRLAIRKLKEGNALVRKSFLATFRAQVATALEGLKS